MQTPNPSGIDNKHRGASWERVAAEFKSERDALRADLNRANERIWELTEAYNAAVKVELHYAKAVAERDALRALLAEAREWRKDGDPPYTLNERIDAALREKP